MNLAAEVLEQGVMSFSSLLHKASNLLGFRGSDQIRPPPLDGEIIYCKNNVCVHPPANLNKNTEHHPGYMNIRSQDDEVLGSTLILTWIPNSTLKKNPRSIENSPAQTKITPRRSPRQEYTKMEMTSAEGSELVSPVCGAAGSDAARDSLRRHSEESSSGDDILRNNERENVQQRRKQCHVGTNVNQIFDKATNIKKAQSLTQRSEDSNSQERMNNVGDECDTSLPESGSQSKLEKFRAQNCAMEQIKDRESRKRSGSSNRSVASIEMDGDNLVVVTEEMDDGTFLDGQKNSEASVVVTADNNLEKQVKDLNISSEGSKDSVPTRVIFEAGNDPVELLVVKNKCGKKPDVNCLKETLDLRLNLESSIEGKDRKVSDHNFNISQLARVRSSSSTSTSGPDTDPPSPVTPTGYHSSPSASSYTSLTLVEGNQASDGESVMMTHNLSFPDNSVTFGEGLSPGRSPMRDAIDQVCGVFSVDLGQMRSLRIFYNDDACTSGQLVIASRESQYKILHFHHGGLDRLVETFADWKFLAQPKKVGDRDAHCRHFSVIRPYLTNDQCHPEEGAYEALCEETWRHHMNDRGQIEDDFHLRKTIFFSGLDAALRHEIWPFLLHYFPYLSTFEEREQLRNDRYIEYQNIRKARESMSEEEKDVFWKSVQCTVEKDVVRTDRSHAYFKGEGNPNIEILKCILLNYAVAHPIYGYTQGMSDLLAPVLAEVQNEVDAFWCFVGLMQKTTFFSSPTDVDMDGQLIYLRELLRLLLPHFYEHLQKVQDGLELLFCHRWLLLCFKREFQESDALRMWEVCWARYQTDFFHLFICVAIISVYGEDVVQQDLPADEMLLHFNSLSMHMSGEVVLRKARGLMHQFRTKRTIPCTLDGLCTLCSPGMWDSGHVPAIECIGNHPNDVCPSAVNRSKNTQLAL